MRRSLMLTALIIGAFGAGAMAQSTDIAGERYEARAAEAERTFGGSTRPSVQALASPSGGVQWNSGGGAQTGNQTDRYRQPNPLQVRNTTNPFQLRNTTNPFQLRNTTNPLQLRNTENPLQQHR
jgi:hypothetical protein